MIYYTARRNGKYLASGYYEYSYGHREYTGTWDYTSDDILVEDLFTDLNELITLIDNLDLGKSDILMITLAETLLGVLE